MVKTPTKDDLKEAFLGSASTLPTEITDEEPAKVTILLPKDTLAMIDAMVKNAKVGSRGRLIQLLIDDIWDFHGEYKFLTDTMDMAAGPQADRFEVILRLSIGVNDLLRRLSRYYDLPVKKMDDESEKTV